jgi:hypothetical protein
MILLLRLVGSNAVGAWYHPLHGCGMFHLACGGRTCTSSCSCSCGCSSRTKCSEWQGFSRQPAVGLTAAAAAAASPGPAAGLHSCCATAASSSLRQLSKEVPP